MRCYFTWDEETQQKILIPHCYSVMYSDDIKDCACTQYNKSQKQFEKEAYNKRVSELTEEIIYLQAEYEKLLKIIEIKTPKIMKNINLPDIELVSAKVHEAWINSKLAQGVTSRKSESGEEMMVSYNALSENCKDLDRNTVKAVYKAIEEL